MYVRLAIALIVLLAGFGGYFYLKKQQGATHTREQFESALKQMKAANANPMSKVFAAKDFPQIEKMLVSEIQDRTAILQGGVVYFDGQGAASWSGEELTRLANTVLDQMLTSLKAKADKKSVVLSFHLLKRVLPKIENPELSSKLDKLLSPVSAEKSPYEFSLYADMATMARPLPKLVLTKIERCVQDRDLGLAQSCLSMGEQIADPAKQREWVEFLAGKYSSLKDPLKPFAARVLFSRHEMTPKRADELLKTAAKSKDETWQDVFLFGVAEMKREADYQARVKELSQTAESPIIRQKARSLIR